MIWKVVSPLAQRDPDYDADRYMTEEDWDSMQGDQIDKWWKEREENNAGDYDY